MLTHQLYIRHKLHGHGNYSFSLALITSSAIYIEREMLWLQSLYGSRLLFCEQITNIIIGF